VHVPARIHRVDRDDVCAGGMRDAISRHQPAGCVHAAASPSCDEVVKVAIGDVVVAAGRDIRPALRRCIPQRCESGGLLAFAVLDEPESLPKHLEAPEETAPAEFLDLLSYGASAPLGFESGSPDRSFAYDIARAPGFLDGSPGLWWTIDERMGDDVPMHMVAEGDVVTMRITNASGEGHPMHLHGHHVVVLARDGVPASGSPWWVDSLEVGHGERYDVAFVADNPGVWMDHCHNLPHAAEGLMTHVMYEGVTTPFLLARASGNEPERARASGLPVGACQVR